MRVVRAGMLSAACFLTAACSAGTSGSSPVTPALSDRTQSSIGAAASNAAVAGTFVHTSSSRGPTAIITRKSVAQAGGDTTDDTCIDSSWSCVIAGQTFQVTWNYSNLPAGETVTWKYASPDGYAGTLKPIQTTSPPYSTVLTVSVPSSAKVKTAYTYAMTPTCSPVSCGKGTGYFDVLCSNAAHTCPEIEILDERVYHAGVPKEVDGSPPPVQSVAIGQEMDVATQWKSGTGTSGTTYSVQTGGVTWSLGGTPVKSYALDGAGEVALTASDTVAKSEINFYWLRGGDPKGDRVLVNAPLLRSDGAESASASAGAQYKAIEPVVSTFGFQQKSPIAVGTYEVPATPSATPMLVNALGIGHIPATNTSEGVDFDYEASAPQIVGGYFAATQTIGNQILTQPGNMVYGGTNYTTELDACPIFASATHVTARSLGVWKATDSPVQPLNNVASSVTELDRHDYYDSYFMWKPDTLTATATHPARSSIWMTVGKISWQWAASAKRQNATSPWTGPDATNDGSGPYLYFAPTPETTQPPQWSTVDASGKPAACAALPR